MEMKQLKRLIEYLCVDRCFAKYNIWTRFAMLDFCLFMIVTVAHLELKVKGRGIVDASPSEGYSGCWMTRADGGIV